MESCKEPADHATPVMANQSEPEITKNVNFQNQGSEQPFLSQSCDQSPDVFDHVHDEVVVDTLWLIRVIEAPHVHRNNMVILN